MPRISHCWIVNTIYNEQSHWLGPCSEYCVFYIQMASIDFVTRTKLDYKQTDELWSTGSLMDAIKLSQISDNYSCTNQCLWRWNTFHPFPGVLIGLRLKTQFQTPISSCTFYSLHYGAPCLSTSLCLYCNSKYYKRLQSNASPGAILVEDANPPLRNNSLKHSTLDNIFITEQKDQIVFFREHLLVHFTLC